MVQEKEQDAVPQDAVVIKKILASMGVEDYEPRVVDQLLNFLYQYVTDILEDAEAYGERLGRGRGEVAAEEVLMSIQARALHSFVQPPPQDVMTALAARRNKVLLPELGKRYGLRLPPDEDCLIAPVYQLPQTRKAQAE